MPNGLLILAAFLLYGLFVYGPRLIGRKRKIIGKPYKAHMQYIGQNKRIERLESVRLNLDEYGTVPGLRRRRVGPPSYDEINKDMQTLREVNARRGK
jgi:hypothetical protein